MFTDEDAMNAYLNLEDILIEALDMYPSIAAILADIPTKVERH